MTTTKSKQRTADNKNKAHHVRGWVDGGGQQSTHTHTHEYERYKNEFGEEK